MEQNNLYQEMVNAVGENFIADLRSYASCGNDFFKTSGKRLYYRVLDDDEMIGVLRDCANRGLSCNPDFNAQFFRACEVAGVSMPIIPKGLLTKNNEVPQKNCVGINSVTFNAASVQPVVQMPVMPQVVLPQVCAESTGDVAKKAIIAQLFLSRNPMYKKGDDFFLYCSGHYDKVTKSGLRDAIAAFCFKAAEKADTARLVDNVMDLVLSNPITKPSCDLADDPTKIFTSDGYVVDLLNLDAPPVMVPFPHFFSTYLNVPASAFVPGAVLSTPALDRILAFQYENNPLVDAKVATLNAWEIIGYILANYQGLRVIPIFQGVGGCGKSVLGRLFELAKPAGKTFSVKVEELGGRFTLANTANADLVILPDMAAKAISDESAATLKIMSGRDAFTTDVKYEDRQKIVFKGKAVGFTNHGVVLKTADVALVQRFRNFPFFRSVPLKQQDPGLLYKLQLEMSGIVVKSLRAFAEMLKHGQDFAGGYVVNQFLQTVITPSVAIVENPVELYVTQRVVYSEGAKTFSSDFAVDCSQFISRNGLGGMLNYTDYQGFCKLFATEIKKHFPRAISTKLSPGKGLKSRRCYLNIAIKGGKV